MTNTQFDKVVFIGRMRPFHKGHLKMALTAFEHGKEVIMVIGSAFKAPTPKNPWKWREVESMIRSSLPDSLNKRLTIVPLRDYGNDSDWLNALSEVVTSQCKSTDKITVLGFEKDESSYYLHKLPWPITWVHTAYESGLSATHIRDILYARDKTLVTKMEEIRKYVPSGTLKFIEQWAKKGMLDRVMDDNDYYTNYQKHYGKVGPGTKENPSFTSAFITADFLLTCQLRGSPFRYLLLIERFKIPGVGNIAMPGGFIEGDETPILAACREAVEETNYQLSFDEFIAAYYKSMRVASDPKRSLRGRVVSFIHHFDLGIVDQLPKVTVDIKDKETSKVFWVPLEAIDHLEEQFFEDHYSEIKKFKLNPRLPVLDINL